MKNTRKKMSAPQPLRNVLKEVLKDWKQKSGNNLEAVSDIWVSAVGDINAQHTSPHAMREKLLIVHVSNPMWHQELERIKKIIIENINRIAKKVLVEDIIFKTGEL
ncbi:RNA-binding protein [Candidatus Magnetomoraceae bacterium gMMP-1]